jgi:ligand-binding sensor domain-containing protein/signal transduction histidine kinase
LVLVSLFGVVAPARAANAPTTVTLQVVPGKDVTFTALTSTDGLSSAQVFGIAQDDNGFLWFATGDGLNRYDGYSLRTFRFERDDPNSLTNNTMSGILRGRDGALWLPTTGGGLDRFDPATETFTHYRHDPANPNSLSGNHIHTGSLLEDHQGALWIGTVGGGLNRLDPRTRTFTHYRHDPANPSSLSSDQVSTICQDKSGIMWVGTTDGGLNRFDPASGRITRYQPDPKDPNTLPGPYVNTILEDRSGTLWVGTQQGLGMLDRTTGRFTRYSIASTQGDAASLNAVSALHEDSAGNLWLGTGGAGILRYDRQRGQLVQYKKDDADPRSLRNNFLSSFLEDPSGTLWAGTLGGGANMLPTRPPKFAHYKHEPGNPNSVADNFILSIFEDHTGTVWIGNDRTLNRWDRRSNSWQVYRNDPADPTSISNGSVTATVEDPDGTLWFGTFLGGLNRFDPASGRFQAYRFNAASPRSLSDDIVRSLYRDSSGVLWVGGWHNGVSRFDRATGTFQRYVADPARPGSLAGASITDILEDRAKRLWVATEDGGLNLLDRTTQQFTHYRNDPKNLKSLPDDAVRVLYEDRAGQLWIGTVGGLCAFDPANGTCRVYTQKDGLPNNTIEGILEDSQGRLWISTNNGLSRFDPKTRIFRNYDTADGLQSNEFHVFTAFHSSARTGDLYFGGVNGFNVFNPAQVADNPLVAPVVLTDFRLANHSLPVGKGSLLHKTIQETKRLRLAYNQNNLSFEFASLSYVAPKKNKYRYRLEGFDTDWHQVNSNERLAVYTNLDAGEYVFRLQGTNEDGVWNEAGVTLAIAIPPPWWVTWWFMTLAVAAVIGLAYGAYRLRVRTIQLRSAELERQVARRTVELAEANKELETFAYSVSHDLRAPLRHIDGFIAMLEERTRASLDERSVHYLHVITESAQRMGNLIDDLLSFSRMSRSDMVGTRVDLNRLVREAVEECTPETENRDIQWKISPLPIITGDRAMLRVALTNLITNAVKFTRPRSTAVIEVGATTRDEESVVFVRDNGVGFDQEYADKLFGMFQRLHTQEEFEGTGIGLATVHRIIGRHGGRVRAESEAGHGATFYLAFPAPASQVPEQRGHHDSPLPEDRAR